jgi:predicted CoA-binding protein
MAKTVAILGASADRAKYGNKAVRAHQQQGYEVYPVNPRGDQIEGLMAYRSLADVPLEHLSRISVYLPPAVLLGALDEIAAKGCDELFLNPGTESPAVLARAQELGLAPIQACSIVDLGMSPHEMEDF